MYNFGVGRHPVENKASKSTQSATSNEKGAQNESLVPPSTQKTIPQQHIICNLQDNFQENIMVCVILL